VAERPSGSGFITVSAYMPGIIPCGTVPVSAVVEAAEMLMKIFDPNLAVGNGEGMK